MNQTHDYLQDIASIRLAMERSVKFLSLSGLSGVLAGLYALAGAAVAWWLVYYPLPPYGFRLADENAPHAASKLLLVATLVLILSLATGYYMSMRKARRLGVSVWNKTSRDFLTSFFIPLLAGGFFILLLLYHEYFVLIAPACLIFYGLALISASIFTVREIWYLGLMEICLGLLATLWPAVGLLLWAVGFGILHIVYGLVVHYRYDREKSI